MRLEIKQIVESNIGLLDKLAIEAQSEGFNFVQRAIDEWKNGTNEFSKNGEVLLGIFIPDLCVGVGGLNIDPYIDDPNIGRIRHVYIVQEHRRKGFATKLLKKIFKFAAMHFELLRLYTDIPSASSLYESLGFSKSIGIKVTHILKI